MRKKYVLRKWKQYTQAEIIARIQSPGFDNNGHRRLRKQFEDGHDEFLVQTSVKLCLHSHLVQLRHDVGHGLLHFHTHQS